MGDPKVVIGVLLVPVMCTSTLMPEQGLKLASRIVAVIVEVVEPSATTGPEPKSVELVRSGGPATNVTIVLIESKPTGSSMVTVLSSALIVATKPVVSPLASVAGVWVTTVVLPLEGSV